LGEAFDFAVGFWKILWGSIALGLDGSGKSMNHFVGWDFFSSGWIEQSRPTQLGSKGQFSGTGKRDMSRAFLLILKVAGILGAFCSF
jgi:hypothetical protein